MLPKIDVPLYEITLPLTKKTIKIRPFLVKEEKILLMAVESEDQKSVMLAIKQVVNNCCVDAIDVDDIPMTDLEFIFLNLRARSIGEIVELQYKCNNTVKDIETGEEKPCNNIVPFEVNLLDIKPEVPKDHNKTIQLTDKIGVVLSYPTFAKHTKLDDNKSTVETTIDMIILCVESIYDEETVYYAKDSTPEEIREFLESLTKEQFGLIQNFFSSIPKIKTTLDFKCPKCGYNEKIDIEGMQNFFS